MRNFSTHPKPKIKGSGAYNQKDQFLKQECGVDFGTTISLIPSNGFVALNLNINRKLNWVINCVDFSQIEKEEIEALKQGKCFVLIKPRCKVIELNLEELIAFNSGSHKIEELATIREQVDSHRDFFKDL